MSLSRKINFGVLLIRIGLAIALLGYSLPKVFGGEKVWANAGGMLSMFGSGLPFKTLGLSLLILMIVAGVSVLTGFFFKVFAIITSVIFLIFSVKYNMLGLKVLSTFSFAIAFISFALIYIGTGAYVLYIRFRQNNHAL